MAQMMRFHRYPTNGVGTTSFWISVGSERQERSLRGGDGDGGAYDWANMALVPSDGVNLTQRQAIGALCHDAGVAIGASYGPSVTYGFFTNVRTALTATFAYSNAVYGSLSSQPAATRNVMINPNLDMGRPVILGISRPGGSHAIVCDGYGYASATLYHHLNMGWGGNYDAWYHLPDIPAGNRVYDTVHTSIYNVFAMGSGEIISGRVVDESWAPIPGATVIANGTYTTTTNARGIFALAKIPSATTYTVNVTKEGHTFPVQTVTTGTSTDYTATCGNVWYVLFGPLDIVTQSPLPDAITAAPYSMCLWAAGGKQPYTWSITAGALPLGLSLSPSTGEILGTASSGEVATFTATVTDSASTSLSRQFQLRVRTNVTVTSVTARDIQVGDSYAITAKIRNDISSGATVHVDCLVDDGAGGTQALATQTVTIKAGRTARVTFNDPSTLGPGSCIATVTVREDPDVGASNGALFVIDGNAPPALQITTESLPYGVIDQAYNAAVEATGGTTPYLWGLLNGSLPTGLDIDPDTGVISGTPTKDETQTFTVGVFDSSVEPQLATVELTITVGTAPVVDVTVVSVTARDIREGAKYNITVKIRNDSSAQATIHVDCLIVDGEPDSEPEGEPLPKREVTIAVGETATVKFDDASAVIPGTYMAIVAIEEDSDVGENDSDTFEVK